MISGVSRIVRKKVCKHPAAIGASPFPGALAPSVRLVERIAGVPQHQVLSVLGLLEDHKVLIVSDGPGQYIEYLEVPRPVPNYILV